MSSDEVRELIARARRGDQAALGKLLERYRPYFHSMARDELDPRLNRRIDASDIVQESFLDAQRGFAKFEGAEEVDLIHWLRRVVLHNVIEQARHHKGTQKRSLDRETTATQSGGQHRDSTVASEESSVGSRMVRREESDILFRTMENLPVAQREAVRLHYLDGWPVRQIAEYLDRTEVGVAGLIKRGVRSLRQSLGSEGIP